MALGVVSTSAGGAASGPTGEPMLVDMSQVAVPIIDGDRVQGMLQVRLAFNTADSAGVDQVTAALPRLRSATVVTLVEFARLHASPFRAVDSDRLSRALSDSLRKAEPAVTEVLLLEVSAKSG
jgi:hypothetical protein